MKHRSKSRGSRSTTPFILTGSRDGQFDSGVTVTDTREGFNGYDIPDFKSRKKAGELLPHTPFTQFANSGGFTGTYTQKDLRPGGSHWWNEGPFPWFYGDPFPTIEKELDEFIDRNADMNYFVQAAAAKVYSSGWDAATFAAELKHLVRMFKGIAGRLVKLATQRDLKRSSKNISNAYLEGRYGWRTLIYDIQDFNNALTAFDTHRTRYSEKVGTRIKDSNAVTWNATPNWDMHVFLTRYTEFELSCRGSVVADIKPPQFGFNPITTAWEIKSLSFVVDWAINIGQSLEACSFLVLSSDSASSGGIHATAKQSLEVSSVSFTNGYTTGTATAGGTATRTVTSRTPMSISAMPQVRLRLDAFKILDLLALLRQRF